MQIQKHTINSKTIIPKNNKKPTNANKWLIERLLNGERICHDDAINAGFWHRLAVNVLGLRHDSGWKGIIKTDNNGFYYIHKHAMDDAKVLAKRQFNIDTGSST